ncbi:hypothetical protein N9P69_00840 [Gammaproteobacteria bacterium]|jgi:hypothetical protein|uniref:hypothetical protein n=1 Tax=uncultured Maribacter sp. TaxID=431308 RepID=UPI0023202520|nr:hypothetical protein [Gammaproteobacteria bacterium]|tara:strand:+ start:2438 stop:2674 length:237 start_codon:yes stop_codon:yes gene_type:complete
MKFSKYTIVNEVIMQIVGLFAKLNEEDQKLIIKTLQQTMARNKEPEDDDLEAKEEEQRLQNANQQHLSDLEEIDSLLD